MGKKTSEQNNIDSKKTTSTGGQLPGIDEISQSDEIKLLKEKIEKLGDEIDKAAGIFKGIVESTDAGIMIEDEQGLVSFANPGLVKMLNYESKEEIIGLPWSHFFSLEQEKKVKGSSGVFESLLVTKVNKQIPILITSTSFYFRDEYVGVLSVIKDISVQKRAELAFARSQMFAVMAQMSMGISHEIKNPLAVMQAHIELLSNNSTLKNSGDDKLKYSFEVIKNQADRINFTLRSLSLFSSAKESQVKTVNLAAILNQLSEMFAPKLDKAHVFVIRNYDKDRFAGVAGSEPRLTQLFANLIFNAIESMPTGGTLELSLSEKMPDKFYKVTISDTGCGIPKEHIDNIFEPFFTTKADGMGMGLLICRQIVDETGGNMFIESKTGQGTKIIVRLPAAVSSIENI
jgi:signal transduction histidine kinase